MAKRGIGHLTIIFLVMMAITLGVVHITSAVSQNRPASQGTFIVLVPDPEVDIQTFNLAHHARSLPPPVVPPAIPKMGMLGWPVPGGWISQYYSWQHLAIDIAYYADSPVLAAAPGIVIWAGWRNNGGGYVIAIDHGIGVITSYNHLGSILVRYGQIVDGGQIIGKVGCTGTCTGPHVHFAVEVNGVLVNPLRYL